MRHNMAHPPPGPYQPPGTPPGPHDPPSPPPPPPTRQHYGPSKLYPGMTSLWPEETCLHGFHGAVTA